MSETGRRENTSGDPCCGIAVMAKASVPGRAKTRLVPPLTADEAAELNTAFLKDVVENIAAAAQDASIRGYVAFGPPETAPFFKTTLPAPIELIDAWFPNFGDCLFAAIKQVLGRGHGSAVVLNSDSPTLPTALLAAAAQFLARPGDRAVLGPARDGGYYLLGLKTPHRRLFEDVAWSTEHVAAQTLARAAEIGLEVHVLPDWYDVDDAASLRQLHQDLEDGQRSSATLQPHAALYSRKLLGSLLKTTDLRLRLNLAPGPELERAAE
jgi:rSAM/selenodomain-associated transferase 1